MKLAGQARFARTPSDAGYAMAALLVAMSIVAVMMTVAMPVWKQATQREKEEELVFRGLQYAHAIQLYGRKFANSQPPNFDVLVQQRFLRKKYKDPITNDDFQPVTANQPAPGAAGASGAAGGRGSGASPGPSASPAPASGSGASSGAPSTSAAPQSGRGITPIGTPGSQPAGGIIGVTSKSKDKSIRLYNGRSHYNEWLFVYQPQQQTPGGGMPGASVPGRGTGRNTNVPGGGGFGGVGGGRGGGGQRGRGGQGGERGGPGGGPFGPGGNRGFGPSGPAFPSPTPATPTGGGGRRD